MTCQQPDQNLVKLETASAFADVLERLTRAIEGAGMQIFARIDHAALAAAAGLALQPTTVLIYGNPKGGTPVMLASPEAALDLPLRVLVAVDAVGRTTVSFHPVVEMLTKLGVPTTLAERLLPGQRILFESVLT